VKHKPDLFSVIVILSLGALLISAFLLMVSKVPGAAFLP
jgi:hypothetical protein